LIICCILKPKEYEETAISKEYYVNWKNTMKIGFEIKKTWNNSAKNYYGSDPVALNLLEDSQILCTELFDVLKGNLFILTKIHYFLFFVWLVMKVKLM